MEVSFSQLVDIYIFTYDGKLVRHSALVNWDGASQCVIKVNPYHAPFLIVEVDLFIYIDGVKVFLSDVTGGQFGTSLSKGYQFLEGNFSNFNYFDRIDRGLWREPNQVYTFQNF
jgi:hypothetical protein